ncbi:MAG: Uridylate kinase [bacterium ADurb.Bin400]|nr:MAG: Uridylate kinase [bacterium ADurb.Bin400]
MASLAYERVLLKLSGEALMGSRSYGIEPETVDKIAQEIAETRETGAEVVIVLGGGNIFRGISAEKHGLNRTTGDYIGMLATVMNSLALGSALRKIGVENRVSSAIEMPKVCETYIRDRAIRNLEKGRVVIVGAGSGNPYFSTDTAAAMRACELDCNAVFKATKVDGVFDRDPEKDPGAKKIKELGYLDVLNNRYAVMDNTAITLCMDNKLPIMVFELMAKGNVKRAVLGEHVGTIIH